MNGRDKMWWRVYLTALRSVAQGDCDPVEACDYAAESAALALERARRVGVSDSSQDGNGLPDSPAAKLAFLKRAKKAGLITKAEALELLDKATAGTHRWIQPDGGDYPMEKL